MSKLPIRRAQFKTQPFLAWLTEQGAEVGATTNPYEVVRYRSYVPGATKAGTHIVYAKESGLLTFTGATRRHYEAFLAGEKIAGMFVSQFDASALPTKAERKSTREKLFERDGDQCWFCGLAMGADQTIEHLVPKSAGGRNSLSNYALAHAACNHSAGNMPLIEKIELRNRLRAEAKAEAS